MEEEAHLSAVHDPAGGSYYVETLTDALAKAGWEELQRIERAGGARHHLSSGAHEAELARALKQAGVHRVLIARRVDESSAALGAAGVDEWVYIGADLVAVLERTLRALEVS